MNRSMETEGGESDSMTKQCWRTVPGETWTPKSFPKSSSKHQEPLWLPRSDVLRPLSHWTPFLRLTCTSRHSKVLDQPGHTSFWAAIVTVSVFIVTVVALLNAFLLGEVESVTIAAPSTSHQPSPCCWPDCLPCFTYTISNAHGAPWGKCYHAHFTGVEAEARQPSPNGRGRSETKSAQHHRLCFSSCRGLSELLFTEHLLSSRHQALWVYSAKRWVTDHEAWRWICDFPRSSKLVTGLTFKLLVYQWWDKT